MRVLKGIQNGPFSKSVINLILRLDTEDFWNECITQAGIQRVCAVGSPGIGKSITTAFLIKQLLEDQKTVVFLKRTESRDSWYCQFVPTADGSRVTTTLFSEETKPSDIPSLRDPKTYYVVDPEKTKDSCDPSLFVKAKVIINSSPNPMHWGDNEFTKARDSTRGGCFRVYPLWTLPEMRAAAPLVLDTCNPDLAMISQRFYRHGGTARIVFAEDTDTADEAQTRDMGKLTVEQAKSIAMGEMQALDTFSESQPKSSVMGYESKAPYDTRSTTAVLTSEYVTAEISKKYSINNWK